MRRLQLIWSHAMKLSIKPIACLLMLVSLSSGCAAFRQSVNEEDPRNASMITAKFDQRDLIEMAEAVTADIIASPFPEPATPNPIIAPLGILNNTRTHLDVDALEKTITTMLMDNTQMRFVNTGRRDTLLKEQGYQLANATEETRANIGRQLGAGYMLTGSITEINAETGREVRLSKTEDVFYQLTIEITDLETGLIMVRKQQDRLRRKSRPVFGW